MSSSLQTVRIIAALSYRNLFRNKRRTVLTFLAIVVGVWSALSLSSLARGLSTNAIDDAIDTLVGHGQIHLPTYIEDPTVDQSFLPPHEILSALKESSLISKFTARIKVPAVALSERSSVGVTLVGIIPKEEIGLSFLPDSIDQGSYFKDDGEEGVIVGKALLSELETEIGRRIVVMSTGADGSVAEVGVRIVATFDASLESTETGLIFFTRKKAQAFLGLTDQVSLISFRLFDKDNLDLVISSLKRNSGELSVTPWTTLEPLLVAVTNMQNGFLRLWFFIVVLAICFGLINTLFMSIYERKQEFSLLQSLGMKPRWIASLVMIESALLLLLGTLCAVAIAVITVAALQGGIDISRFSEGTAMLRVPPLVIPTIVAGDWWFACLLILILGLLGALYPAWKAAHQPNTERN